MINYSLFFINTLLEIPGSITKIYLEKSVKIPGNFYDNTFVLLKLKVTLLK